MELTQLRYFLAAAQREHITAAAESLHVAQPALTQSIKRLEEELGVPLFERNGRGVMLTRYGAFVQKTLLPAVEILDALPESLKMMAKLENETIHINMLAASSAATIAIIEYKRLHPKINFQLIQQKDMSLCDISITTKPSNQPHDKSSASISEEIFLAVPKYGKFAGKTAIRLEEVSEEPFISFSDSKQFRKICDGICGGAGFAPKIALESDNTETVKNAIAAGLGVGFWPAATWGKMTHGGILLLPISHPTCRRDVIVSKNTHKPDMRVIDDFFSFLVERLQKIMAEK